ncbi:hypothetical protein TNCV_3444981, partial [Trichonephila clavipes]
MGESPDQWTLSMSSRVPLTLGGPQELETITSSPHLGKVCPPLVYALCNVTSRKHQHLVGFLCG